MTDDDVRSVFDWMRAIEELRSSYALQASPDMFPPRSMARGSGAWLRALSGVSPDGGIMGVKLIAASTSAKIASYLISLFDQKTAALVALMDGNSVTGFRTAATSALAADALANPGPVHLAVIGSGFEAKTHVRALASVRVLESVAVFSPNPNSRQKFIDELADLGLPMRQAESARDAADDADLLLCAARSRDESPTFRGEWLKPGMTVISIGSTLPEQREIDPEAIRRSDLIVADMKDEVVHDTGDMIAAAVAGVSFDDKLIELADLIGGANLGRTSAEQIILYKSVGAAIQDITVAEMCFRRAIALGVGSWMPERPQPVFKGK